MLRRNQGATIGSSAGLFVLLVWLFTLWRFTSVGLFAIPSLTRGDGSAAVPLAPAPGSARHRLVQAEIDGRPARLLLDTGAARTALDVVFAAPMDRRSIFSAVNGAWGWRDAATIARLTIGAWGFEGFEAEVMDLAAVGEGLGVTVHGVLGMNVLGAAPAAYDFIAGVLVLGQNAAEFERADRVVSRLPIEVVGGSAYVEAAVDGAQLLFLVDSGSSITTIAAAQIQGGGSAGAAVVNVAGQHEAAAEGAATIQLGHVIRARMPVLIGTLTVLGADFFGGTALWIDVAGGSAILATAR